MSKSVTDIIQAAIDWLTNFLNAKDARATVFGVQVDARLFVEGLLVVGIIYLLTQKIHRLPKRSLQKEEIDQLCDEWTPEPLVPTLSEEVQRESPVLESAARPHTTVNGKDVVNFASADYLGLVGHEKLIDSCTSALEKYGVGSCSTRAFYGTFDVHADCEAKIAKFLGTPDSIIYSYGLSTMFSVIPALCNKEDIIAVDEGVHWGIQNGLCLSGSKVVYFKHNDMSSLEGILERIASENKKAKKIRRYIVVEAVYQNSGQIAPLDKIIRLKERYHFRVMLDESNSFGVLGSSGRGLTEHYGVPIQKVDIVTAALATEGGFCTGSVKALDVLRISSTGYTRTGALPPYLASAAISAIDVIEDNLVLINKLKENISVLWAELEGLHGLEIASDPHSPIVFLRLTHSSGSMKGHLKLIQDIVDQVLEEDAVLVVASKRSIADTCSLPIGIKLFVSASHSESDLSRVSQALKRVAHVVL